MKTYVISGGTDGIGRAVALDRLAAKDQVVVIGRNEAKGAQVLAEAQAMGAGDRAHFIAADLSLVAATHAAVTEVKARFPAVDGLVCCAPSTSVPPGWSPWRASRTPSPCTT